MKASSYKKIYIISIVLLMFFLLMFFSLHAQKQESEAADSMVAQLQHLKNDTGKVKLLSKICLQLSYTDPARAAGYGRMAYALSEKLRWKKGMAEATRYIAAMMVDAANEDSALYYLDRSYNLYKDLGDTEGMIANIYNRGAFLQHTSRYSEAMASFFKGIDLAEKSTNKAMMAKGYSLVATVLVQQKDFDKARQYSLKALDVFKEISQPDGELECLEMIGYGYMMDNKLKEAKPYFTEALQLSDSVHNDLVKAKIYTQLVSYSEYSRQPAERLDYLQKAQAIWNKIGPSSLYSIANIANIGSLYLDLYAQPVLLQQMPDSIKKDKPHFLEIAATQVQKAIGLSKTEKNPDLLSQLYQLNAQVLEAKHDYKGALASFKSFVNLRDSMFSQENKNKIAAIEVSKALQLKDKTIALKKAENRQLWLYAVLLLALVIMVSACFIGRYRLKQLRLKNIVQQREALQQSRELEFQNQLTLTELKAIRAQMNPHFIFNVLNSIESYILEQDARMASRLLQKFASLCRLILENSAEPVVRVDREWMALQLYTELEAVRFDRQFKYVFYKDEKVAPATLISPMMMQPLIENAIHHGLRNSDKKDLLLKVSVEAAGDTLKFTVEDNGAGPGKAERPHDKKAVKQQSFGIKMIKERIAILNQSDNKDVAGFSLERNEPFTIATLILPIFHG